MFLPGMMRTADPGVLNSDRRCLYPGHIQTADELSASVA